MIREWLTQSLSPSLKRWWSDAIRFQQFYLLDPRCWFDLFATLLQARRALRKDRPGRLPSAKEPILELSERYQAEWRFERDRRLMQQALDLFPDWDYAVKRLEWHSRPVFHRDPQLSKTQARTPLRLPRNPVRIPRTETMESLCFVIASGSDEPYFSLSIQLIESIQATRQYGKVPIKVLDCGLTPDDVAYLVRRFGVDVKDPGWDVDPARIRGLVPRMNGWKASTSRPYIHRHFPGYEYYFWMDTDTWIQDERAVDQFVTSCEEQGLAVGVESPCYSYWSRTSAMRTCYYHSIPTDYALSMQNRRVLINSIYCIRRDMCERLRQETELMLTKQKYVWGVDLAMLNYVFHTYLPGGTALRRHFLNDENAVAGGINMCLDREKRLTFDGACLGFVGLEWYLKHLPPVVLFANSTLEENVKAFGMARLIARMRPALAEEMLYLCCKRFGWRQGSVFYRIYPEPSADGDRVP